jgi:hypothetical protein
MGLSPRCAFRTLGAPLSRLRVRLTMPRASYSVNLFLNYGSTRWKGRRYRDSGMTAGSRYFAYCCGVLLYWTLKKSAGVKAATFQPFGPSFNCKRICTLRRTAVRVVSYGKASISISTVADP